MSDLLLMLDTNIASHFMRYPEGRVAQRLRDFTIRTVGISVVVVSGLRFGAAKVQSDRLQRQIDWLLGQMTIVSLEPPIDRIYADIRADLVRQGRIIGPNDLFIAAHALLHGVPLATANVGEFSRVPGLRVENWLD